MELTCVDNNNIKSARTKHVVSARNNHLKKYKTKRSKDDPLVELEQMYESLRLDEDEDLLDRAERRDLPSKFQESWRREKDEQVAAVVNHKDNNYKSDGNDLNGNANRDISYEYFDKRRSIGTMEALMALREQYTESRTQRTPPYRRSAIPHLIEDDLAIRKSQSHRNINTVINPMCHINSSYLLFSPIYNPLSSQDLFHQNISDSDPNIEYDDMSHRKMRQAMIAHTLPPPPPFGIPNRVVLHSSPNDYLHSNVDPIERAKLWYRCKPYNPHLIHDDMAFRKLRKDGKDLSVSNVTRRPPALPTRTSSFNVLSDVYSSDDSGSYI